MSYWGARGMAHEPLGGIVLVNGPTIHVDRWGWQETAGNSRGIVFSRIAGDRKWIVSWVSGGQFNINLNISYSGPWLGRPWWGYFNPFINLNIRSNNRKYVVLVHWHIL